MPSTNPFTGIFTGFPFSSFRVTPVAVGAMRSLACHWDVIPPLSPRDNRGPGPDPAIHSGKLGSRLQCSDLEVVEPCDVPGLQQRRLALSASFAPGILMAGSIVAIWFSPASISAFTSPGVITLPVSDSMTPAMMLLSRIGLEFSADQ